MNLKIKEVLYVKIVYWIFFFVNLNLGFCELLEFRSFKEVYII